VNISPALRNWLMRAHDTAPAEPAPGNRLSALAGPLRPAFAVVDGCSVAHHHSGPAFAALVGEKVLLPAAAVTAVLAAEPVHDLAGWVAVDVAPDDVTFARGADALRHALARAYDFSSPTR
jgi:hypothetical protein